MTNVVLGSENIEVPPLVIAEASVVIYKGKHYTFSRMEGKDVVFHEVKPPIDITYLAKWVWDEPKVAGWYAIAYCYDEEEGIYNSAAYWDKEWRTTLPVCASAGPFPDRAEAREWSYANDMGG